MDVYVEDEEISLDLYQDEIERLQELTQEIIYDEADCRRAFHKLLNIAKDDEITVELDKTLEEQNLLCCKKCNHLENNICKEHLEVVEDPESTLCMDYKDNH